MHIAVADPFFHITRNGSLYVFFETKTIASNQGDIGVAHSIDFGATWRYLGIVLDVQHHLAYPFVFAWRDKVFRRTHARQSDLNPMAKPTIINAVRSRPRAQVYMMPDGCGSKELRLYEAVNFPLKWRFHSVLLQRPMIDATLVEWQGLWWMFTSDVVGVGDRGIVQSGDILKSVFSLCSGLATIWSCSTRKARLARGHRTSKTP